MRKMIALIVTIVVGPSTAFSQQARATYRPENDRAISSWLDENLAGLVSMYKHLHANPELSLEEKKTAALVAEELRRCGYDVTENVGGTGVVGVMRNGQGPTLLIRGDMDALPVIEETHLEYASKVRVKRPDGTTVGAMHACGHDAHTTTLIGTGRLLGKLRDRWNGTVVLIAQPAEELGKGARMMIADGLFDRFPRPDFCIGLHVAHNQPVGQIGVTSGWAMANVDSVDITIYGRGGHGARPHESVDPVVAAAHVVTALQTLVSRRVNPTDPAVVTVGSIHGGSKHNIIPDEVRLQLTVRSYTEQVRRQLLDSIRQIATDTCKAMGCSKPPDVSVLDEFTPAAYNDPALTATAVDVFRKVFGEQNVIERAPEMGGEDFGLYARTLNVPGFMFRVGTVSLEDYEASLRPDGPALPAIHSSTYAPVPEPTLRTGIRAMTNLAMALLAPE